MTRGRPKLSVVVASHNARGSIEECLASLVAPQPEGGAEIVVVDNSTDATADIIRERFPDVRLIVEPPTALITEMWAVGICQTAGDIVAITTAHCVPSDDWLAQMLKAHEGPVAAVGGAIENDQAGRPVDWAIYFCRYSRYMLPFREGFVSDIAGDNASYKRADIDRCQHVWRTGFWEPAVHAELRKAGLRLSLLPSVVIYHKQSFGLWSFIEQRFRHGMQFGAERASRFSKPKRALYVVLSPVIPLVFLVRTVRQVLAKRRHRKELLVSLPILLVFLLSWALGELIGYLRGTTV
jgi:glycosyltransferase involved in cell wall biosynthesis